MEIDIVCKYLIYSSSNCRRSTVNLSAPKIAPKEPEHVPCNICMKEVPLDEASSFEAVDYVIHFCGLECFNKWKKEKQFQQENNN